MLPYLIMALLGNDHLTTKFMMPLNICQFQRVFLVLQFLVVAMFFTVIQLVLLPIQRYLLVIIYFVV